MIANLPVEAHRNIHSDGGIWKQRFEAPKQQLRTPSAQKPPYTKNIDII